MFNLVNSPTKSWAIRAFSLAALLFSSFIVTACGGGGGTPNPSPNPNSVSQTITDPTKSTTIPVTPANGQAVNFNVPANSVPANTTVTIATVTSANLPLPITRSARLRSFTPNAGNVYIYAFKIGLKPATVTQFNVPVNVNASGIVPTSIPANTTLNVAFLQNEGQPNAAYNDVGTFRTGANGGFTPNLPTVSLPGVLSPGTYVIYQPAAGTSTTLANFGVALLADDTGLLQVINLYDAADNALSAPKLSSLQFAGANDLDGQALTPDGSFGVLVDGGNTVRFFSGVQTGIPLASTKTVDISSFGGDGDSVAIMPNGDTAVVSGDSDTLVVITGIVSGNPTLTTTIQLPFTCDGVLIANDGKTLIARGAGLAAFAIAPATPAPGSLGGTINLSFTLTASTQGGGQITTLNNIPASTGEDGRDGVGFSPADPSRAIVIGTDGNGSPAAVLLTGLPGTPVVRSIPLNLPSSGATRAIRAPRKRREHTRLALSGVGRLFGVAITPDGKNAVVGTDSGLALLSGVNTGSLAQVGSVFNPNYTIAANGTNSTQTQNLGTVSTLAITLDGRYVVACASNNTSNGGSLLVYPITASGFSTQVGQLDNIGIPGNDQILLH